MSSMRTLENVFSAKPATEGAGVKLLRAFGNAEAPRFDPFLLLDDLSSSTPAEYAPGFPSHPHRGIETVTYVLEGNIRHRDSIGHEGIVGKNMIQWMSAGRGIIHEEMPDPTHPLKGFQIWINLPEEEKMSPPHYQSIQADAIPEVDYHGHSRVKVLAGSFDGAMGPAKDSVVSPTILDISIEGGQSFAHPFPPDQTLCVYVYEGELVSEFSGSSVISPRGSVLVFSRQGEAILLQAGSSGARLLLLLGKPIGEPVAWYGSIVMNREDELKKAYDEVKEGTFIKEI